ncbi:MAG: hypothetical protein O3A00_28460 [Planctomycetota bacterium]|nr:hypothetical protein [Planctomycetota bacterium]
MFRKSCFPLAMIVALATSASAAPRRVDMNFQGQLASAVNELQSKIKADPLLQGRKLRLGKFAGPNLPDSNFEQNFEQSFQVLAKDLITDTSDFIVRGEYDFIDGTAVENQGLQVIQFVISVVHRRKVLQRVTREINNTADITRIIGTTVAPPDTRDIEKRNAKVTEAFDEPRFKVRNTTQITAESHQELSVEIRKRVGGSGSPIAVKPINKGGLAFVDLGVGDDFEIVLFNHANLCDAVAKISIDGLDVANEFSADKAKYDGYTVPRSKDSQPGQHSVAGWLRTAKPVRDNVFRFVINQLGKGAATARRSRSSRGVINIQFFEAVPPNEQLPARTFGEVGTGKPMTVRYRVQPMKLRDTPIVNLSIRYSNVPD